MKRKVTQIAVVLSIMLGVLGGAVGVASAGHVKGHETGPGDNGPGDKVTLCHFGGHGSSDDLKVWPDYQIFSPKGELGCELQGGVAIEVSAQGAINGHGVTPGCNMMMLCDEHK